MTSFHPNSVSFLIQPVQYLLSPRRLTTARSEEGDLWIGLSPQGFSLHNLHRIAIGTLALSTQYYMYHDTLHLIRYNEEGLLLISLILTLLGLTSIVMGLRGMTEAQSLELREGQLIFKRDRFWGAKELVISLDEIIDLGQRDRRLFGDRLLNPGVPELETRSGQIIPFFAYANAKEKQRTVELVDRFLYERQFAA